MNLEVISNFNLKANNAMAEQWNHHDLKNLPWSCHRLSGKGALACAEQNFELLTVMCNFSIVHKIISLNSYFIWFKQVGKINFNNKNCIAIANLNEFFSEFPMSRMSCFPSALNNLAKSPTSLPSSGCVNNMSTSCPLAFPLKSCGDR